MIADGSKILIVLHGAIGDVTRALSLVTRIKDSLPQSHITWAIEPISLPIIEDHPCVDQIVIFDRPKGFPAYVNFIKELRQQRYDVVLDLQRHFKSGVTSFLSGGNRRIGFHRKNAKEFNWLFNNEHIESVENFSAKIEHYQLFGDKIGVSRPEKLGFGVQLAEDSLQRAEKLIAEGAGSAGIDIPEKENRICLILGSTWPSRFWKVSYYSELISELQQKYNATAIFIGAKSERKFADEILATIGQGQVIDLVGKTTLKELFAVFSSVKLAVGSDSGPMHIAAAVGTPIISLWGSTSPKRSAPYGSEHLVLQASIECSPCYKKHCPLQHNNCMSEIVPAAVMNRVSNV